VFQTFEKLAEEGISTDDIEAALNTFEFELRENNTGGFPRGLSLWLKSLNAWNYGADPLELVAFEKPLQSLKSNARKMGYFDQLIRDHFISNTHRTTVVLNPDPHLAERQEAEEKKRLSKLQASMSDHERAQVFENTKRLLKLQATPDTPEALATIPLLQRTDLDRRIRTVAREKSTTYDTTVLTHGLFTNGILYLDIGFDLHSLDQNDLPYAAFLGSALLEMGTRKEDYVSLSQRIAKKTGGIHGTPFLSAMDDSATGVTRFFLRGKCMIEQAPELLDILRDVLLEPNFNDKERFRQIVLEHKSEMETAIVPRGHSAVMTRLKARYNEAHWASEQMGGIEALLFTRKLAEAVDNDWPSVVGKLESILSRLLNRKQIVINLTVDPEAMPNALHRVESFVESLPDSSAAAFKAWSPEKPPASEALTAPTMVNYVGCAANLYDAGYAMHGSALVITRYLQTAWLWEKIRVQGGAYGGMCSFDQRSGVFTFASYRDPNLEESLATYKATGDYLKNLSLSEDELTRALIGAIGQLDSYQLPDAKGYSSCMRYLLDYTDEERQQLRDEVLSTTQEHFNAFGMILEHAFAQPAITVLCSPDAAAKTALATHTKVL
jgi:Zn-dependent M16 (insulinase) family peptidase